MASSLSMPAHHTGKVSHWYSQMMLNLDTLLAIDTQHVPALRDTIKHGLDCIATVYACSARPTDQ